jgi:hypothetical protein
MRVRNAMPLLLAGKHGLTSAEKKEEKKVAAERRCVVVQLVPPSPHRLRARASPFRNIAPLSPATHAAAMPLAPPIAAPLTNLPPAASLQKASFTIRRDLCLRTSRDELPGGEVGWRLTWVGRKVIRERKRGREREREGESLFGAIWSVLDSATRASPLSSNLSPSLSLYHNNNAPSNIDHDPTLPPPRASFALYRKKRNASGAAQCPSRS